MKYEFNRSMALELLKIAVLYNYCTLTVLVSKSHELASQ